MRFLFTTLLLLLFFVGKGQTYKDLMLEYQKGDYEYVIEKGIPLIKSNSEDIDLQLLLGRAYADDLQYAKAIPHLNYVDENAKKKGWRRGWAEVYLGICNFGTGNYEWSRTYLNRAASNGSTDNIRNYAKQQLLFLGFDKKFQDFRLSVDSGILFHFHPDISENLTEVEDFISKQKEAFNSAKQFFNCLLPKEVDIFVWNSVEEMEKGLDFTDNIFVKPELGVIHVPLAETSGKEFSLVVSYYFNGIEKQSALISYGTAIYLANCQKNIMTDAQQALKAKEITGITVKDIWAINRSDSELYNTVSAAFVQYLIEKEGKDKFLDLFKEQTYYNAKKIYGDRFDTLISDFESKLM